MHHPPVEYRGVCLYSGSLEEDHLSISDELSEASEGRGVQEFGALVTIAPPSRSLLRVMQVEHSRWPVWPL